MWVGIQESTLRSAAQFRVWVVVVRRAVVWVWKASGFAFAVARKVFEGLWKCGGFAEWS